MIGPSGHSTVCWFTSLCGSWPRQSCSNFFFCTSSSMITMFCDKNQNEFALWRLSGVGFLCNRRPKKDSTVRCYSLSPHLYTFLFFSLFSLLLWCPLKALGRRRRDWRHDEEEEGKNDKIQRRCGL